MLKVSKRVCSAGTAFRPRTFALLTMSLVQMRKPDFTLYVISGIGGQEKKIVDRTNRNEAFEWYLTYLTFPFVSKPDLSFALAGLFGFELKKKQYFSDFPLLSQMLLLKTMT